MNDESNRILKREVVVYFEVLPWNSPEGTEEKK
jgi:hypothetical protein